MPNLTSKADYKYFIQQCESWIDKLGLKDYKVYYMHDTKINSLAWISRDVEGRVATIGLSVDWLHQPVSKLLLRQTARHEVLHLLLGELRAVGESRLSTNENFNAAEHAIIRRLEKNLG